MAGQKTQPISRDKKELLFEYAHDHRTSMSDVIGSIVERIAEGDSIPPAARVKVEMTEVKYTTPDKYAIAMERARAEGVSLTQWINAELARTLGAE